MTLTALRAAARHRLARMRGVPAKEDSGFALVFVLLVTMMIMMGVTSMLTVTASNVTPASHSADSEAALAAAESGIQYYTAFLNANCTTFNGQPCTAVSGTPSGPTTVVGADGNGTAEKYTTTVLNPVSYLDDGFLRVKSTGTAGTSTRTLLADLKGLPDLLRYAYLSKYETLDPDFLATYYRAHSIKISNDAAGATAAAAANSVAPALVKNSQINWNAPSSTAGTTGNIAICSQLWYGASGRSAAKTSFDASLPVGSDWSATGKVAASGQSVTMYQPCEVTFSSGMAFDGPVYSEDSLYLSYGTFNGSGPTFAVPTQETLPPASTGSTSTDPGQAAGRLYRQFPGVLGGPSKDSTGYLAGTTVQHSSYDLQLPPNANDATATCTYTGPTRIVVTGATATINSPMTATGASPCYTTDGTGPGVANAHVPVAKAVISVVNKGAAASWGTATSTTKPIFATAVAASTTPSGSDANTFKNEQGQTYLAFTSQLQAAQYANMSTSSPKSLVTLANSLLNDTGAPILGIGSPQYQAVAAAGTASPLDPLESASASAVTIQRRTCLLALLGACVSLSAWNSMLTVTVTSGAFPATGDVTQYPTWNASSPTTSTAAPGDVYLEGTGVSGKLSVVAQNDIVVTGPLTTAGTPGSNSRGEPAWKSGNGAIALVSDNNVRVYHPVSCAVTSVVNPTLGYCPNDITGLYQQANPPSTVISSGSFGSAHPAMQYCNMTTGSNSSNCSGVTGTGSGPVTAINAAVFALGGSLMTDNYNRGMAMGNVTVTGGLYQLHRGATGQQWEIQANGTSRASSGYALQDVYLDLEPAGLPYVPSPLDGSSTAAWSVVSVSSPSAAGTP